ncbi:hypothetical protein [Mycobacterium marinum]|uniref:hypothetical protein n=1 Tax=Mycobacterium marinum TaxID=1781 RepID=UPI003FEE807C
MDLPAGAVASCSGAGRRVVALAQYANKLIKRIGYGFTSYRIRALLDADKTNRPGLTSIVVR